MDSAKTFGAVSSSATCGRRPLSEAEYDKIVGGWCGMRPPPDLLAWAAPAMHSRIDQRSAPEAAPIGRFHFLEKQMSDRGRKRA
jgi:hypothetical protein